MKDALLKKGKLIDELQLRIRKMRDVKKAAPKPWHEKLAKLSESTDPQEIQEIYEWATDLPPIEAKTSEVTWDTYRHFASYLSDRLALFIIKREAIDGEKPQAAIDALKKLDAIPRVEKDPVIGMSEYQKVRESVADQFPKIDMRDL